MKMLITSYSTFQVCVCVGVYIGVVFPLSQIWIKIFFFWISVNIILIELSYIIYH